MSRRRPRSGPRRREQLRWKLALANVAVLALALLLAGAATVWEMNRYFVGQLDKELRHVRSSVQNSDLTLDDLGHLNSLADSMKQLKLTAFKPESPAITVVLSPKGDVVRLGFVPDTAERHRVAGAVHDPAGLADSGKVVSVTAARVHYRVIAASLDDGSIVLQASPLTALKRGMGHLLLNVFVVGVVLLVVLAAVSLTLARRRLRPLEDIVATASAIAEGELSRRVTEPDKKCAEVDKLRGALNAMLHQIELAVETRDQVTAKLRQFVADASHELRTPLASIRGYLQLHDRGMLDETEQRRAFDRMGAEAERMGRLVDDLLALARLDQHPPAHRSRVNLARLARDGVTDLRALQPGRPLYLAAPDEVCVPGDEAQLRQVISNLLANVRAHTPPEAAATVEVSAHAEHGTARLKVADSGPGLCEQDAARVFDRFFRSAPDRTRLAGGSGLGMSIVQAVVAAHGGTVSLETAPGRGLAVTVTLPAHR